MIKLQKKLLFRMNKIPQYSPRSGIHKVEIPFTV